jgi:hypothetical protein
MVPEIELLKRSSVLSIGAPISDGSVPDILFSERSKEPRLFGSLGIGPTSWLELMSNESTLKLLKYVGSLPTS